LARDLSPPGRADWRRAARASERRGAGAPRVAPLRPNACSAPQGPQCAGWARVGQPRPPRRRVHSRRHQQVSGRLVVGVSGVIYVPSGGVARRPRGSACEEAGRPAATRRVAQSGSREAIVAGESSGPVRSEHSSPRGVVRLLPWALVAPSRVRARRGLAHVRFGSLVNANCCKRVEVSESERQALVRGGENSNKKKKCC